MLTAIVTRVPESDGTPGLRWAVILVRQPQRRARVIRKRFGENGSVHDWARMIAWDMGATVIAWDSAVILSQHFRGGKAKWHPARQPQPYAGPLRLVGEFPKPAHEWQVDVIEK